MTVCGSSVITTCCLDCLVCLAARLCVITLSFADVTQTPSRFLKNCDDIGLFPDMVKNPFEEAFKKASDVNVRLVSV